MLKKIIILFLGVFVLSGCTDSFRGYFQKSANNRLVDSKGFKGGKRKPLYNNKYISLAKKNIVEDNLDDPEDDDDDYDNNIDYNSPVFVPNNLMLQVMLPDRLILYTNPIWLIIYVPYMMV